MSWACAQSPSPGAPTLAAANGLHQPVPGAASGSQSAFARELLAGLARTPRSVAPKFFYDDTGSALFDRICELPEYYPTRTEVTLLRRHAAEIAELIGADAEIVEFGAGSSRKIRILLDALPRPRRFLPIDISADHLHAAAARLQADYPGLQVQPLAADFTEGFEWLSTPPGLPGARRVGFFPGSSIGNFAPAEALSFLRGAARLLAGVENDESGEGGVDTEDAAHAEGDGPHSARPVGGMLIGVDLVKEPARLHAAYNDAAGVTAAFNLNMLARANRELGADFDLDGFAHYAFYEPHFQRIEMHLVSRRPQAVALCGQRFEFAEGQTLHTENSHKFTIEGFRSLATRAGWRPGPVWCDPEGLFSLHWLAL